MSETYSTGTAASSSTLTAFFDTRSDAQEAADRLKDIGITEGSIRIVGDETRATNEIDERGDADKGFFESLGDFFFPDDDRATYAEGLRRGGTLLTVSNIPAGLYDQTLDILDDEGSVDLDTRSESWRSEGWTGEGYATAGAAGTAAYSDRSLSDASGSAASFAASGTAPMADDSTTLASTARTDALRSDRDEVIPVFEERLRVGKRDTNLGRVRVRSYMVEEPVNESVNLHSERVFVERRPVDRAITDADRAFTDRTIEAEEHGEEAVVSKEARVTEEIGLRRESEDRTETVSDTVRRTEVEIEDERTEAERLTGTAGERRTTDKI